MTGIGSRLKDAREARGLSLSDVARKTRIPEDHLRSIEADQLDALPSGPYRRAWLRAYCELVEVEEPVELPPPADRPLLPLNVVRFIALGTMSVAVGLIVWLQWGPDRSAPVEDPEPVGPDQHVEITARQNVRLKVAVDGEPTYDAVLTGGQHLTFDAHERIEIDVAAVEAIRLSYNGEALMPQGRQDAPRRIVFVDDGPR